MEGHITTFATFLGSHDREKEAEGLFLSVGKFYSDTLRATDSVLLRNQNNLGALYLGMHRLQEAENVLFRTLHLKEGMLGSDHHLTLNTLLNIGNLRMSQGRNQEAYNTYHEFINAYSRIGNAVDMAILKARNNLGEVSMKMGNFDQAQSVFYTLLKDIGSRESEEIPAGFALYVKANLALVLKIQRSYRESTRLYKEVIEGRKAIFGPDHSSTISAQYELSQMFRGRVRLRSASQQSTLDQEQEPSVAKTMSKILQSLDLCIERQEENSRGRIGVLSDLLTSSAPSTIVYPTNASVASGMRPSYCQLDYASASVRKFIGPLRTVTAHLDPAALNSQERQDYLRSSSDDLKLDDSRISHQMTAHSPVKYSESKATNRFLSGNSTASDPHDDSSEQRWRNHPARRLRSGVETSLVFAETFSKKSDQSMDVQPASVFDEALKQDQQEVLEDRKSVV